MALAETVENDGIIRAQIQAMIAQVAGNPAAQDELKALLNGGNLTDAALSAASRIMYVATREADGLASVRVDMQQELEMEWQSEANALANSAGYSGRISAGEIYTMRKLMAQFGIEGDSVTAANMGIVAKAGGAPGAIYDLAKDAASNDPEAVAAAGKALKDLHVARDFAYSREAMSMGFYNLGAGVADRGVFIVDGKETEIGFANLVELSPYLSSVLPNDAAEFTRLTNELEPLLKSIKTEAAAVVANYANLTPEEKEAFIRTHLPTYVYSEIVDGKTVKRVNVPETLDQDDMRVAAASYVEKESKRDPAIAGLQHQLLQMSLDDGVHAVRSTQIVMQNTITALNKLPNGQSIYDTVRAKMDGDDRFAALMNDPITASSIFKEDAPGNMAFQAMTGFYDQLPGIRKELNATIEELNAARAAKTPALPALTAEKIAELYSTGEKSIEDIVRESGLDPAKAQALKEGVEIKMFMDMIEGQTTINFIVATISMNRDGAEKVFNQVIEKNLSFADMSKLLHLQGLIPEEQKDNFLSNTTFAKAFDAASLEEKQKFFDLMKAGQSAQAFQYMGTVGHKEIEPESPARIVLPDSVQTSIEEIRALMDRYNTVAPEVVSKQEMAAVMTALSVGGEQLLDIAGIEKVFAANNIQYTADNKLDEKEITAALALLPKERSRGDELGV